MSFETIYELMSQSRTLTESKDPLHNPQFNYDAKDVKDMAQTDTTDVVSKLEEEDTFLSTASSYPAKLQEVEEIEVIDTDLDVKPDKEKVYLGKYVARDPITGEAFFVDNEDMMQVAPSGDDEVECEIIGKVVSLEDANKVKEADPVEIDFDESAFNKLLAQHIRESYNNITKVGVTKGEVIRSGNLIRLKLEGKVVLKNGKVKPMRFMSEAFNPSKKGLIRFRMSSKLFSESKNAFLCTALIKESIITPRMLRANYRVKSKGKIYECLGNYYLNKSYANEALDSYNGTSIGRAPLMKVAKTEIESELMEEGYRLKKIIAGYNVISYNEDDGQSLDEIYAIVAVCKNGDPTTTKYGFYVSSDSMMDRTEKYTIEYSRKIYNKFLNNYPEMTQADLKKLGIPASDVSNIPVEVSNSLWNSMANNWISFVD